MSGHVVVLGKLGEKDAAALLVDGQLEDLLVDPVGTAAFAPGAILRGRVGRMVKGQGGVFIRLPDGVTGYLRDRTRLSEGKSVLVQVSGVAEAGKALPVTTRVLFRGRWVIVTPHAPGVNVSRSIRDAGTRDSLTALGEAALEEGDDTGMIFRSAARDADPEDVSAEMEALLGLARAVLSDDGQDPELLVDAPDPGEAAWRDWADPVPEAIEDAPGSMEHFGIPEAVEALLLPRLELAGGGHAMIEATRALIAVDVNTGNDTSPAAALKANIALARELPRQLRLRGLGGQVVVDFAPMPKRDRGTLLQVLQAAFKIDGPETNIVGWTAMGLFEIQRKRDRAPLTLLLPEGV